MILWSLLVPERMGSSRSGMIPLTRSCNTSITRAVEPSRAGPTVETSFSQSSTTAATSVGVTSSFGPRPMQENLQEMLALGEAEERRIEAQERLEAAMGDDKRRWSGAKSILNTLNKEDDSPFFPVSCSKIPAQAEPVESIRHHDFRVRKKIPLWLACESGASWE